MAALRCLVAAMAGNDEALLQLARSLSAQSELHAEICAEQACSERIAQPWDVLIIAVDQSSLRGGLDLCARARSKAPALNILFASDVLDRHDIVEVLAQGAIDYIALPASIDEVIARVYRAAGCVTRARGGECKNGDPRLRNLIGCNPRFVREISKIPLFARCEAGVLIFGETGTGKEICAQAIHYLSPRAAHPCVAINCGAIPTELIEAELFGHVRGAYTSASHSREGLVREAEGGTLFLDDVDGLPPQSQAKLLRFLQEREYRQVGSNQVQRADVRVIAASNRQLHELVARGEFRSDLYFRLNVLTLSLPPLRERRDDIPLIARYFVRHFAQTRNRSVLDLSGSAVARLLRHKWPGNVRELMHVIERAVLMTANPVLSPANLQIDGDDSECACTETFRSAKAHLVRQFEYEFLESTLRTHGGNVTRAAEAAGKNRRAFLALMHKHGLKSSAFRTADPALNALLWSKYDVRAQDGGGRG